MSKFIVIEEASHGYGKGSVHRGYQLVSIHEGLELKQALVCPENKYWICGRSGSHVISYERRAYPADLYSPQHGQLAEEVHLKNLWMSGKHIAN